MIAESMAVLVLWPLVAACLIFLLPGRLGWLGVLAGLLPLPFAMVELTRGVLEHGSLQLAIADFQAPLGIVWQVDGLALVLLWLNVVIVLLVGLYAAGPYRASEPVGRRFWVLWLLLGAAMNALLMSADLFNLFVTLELVTLAAIGLLVIDRKPAALRAAVRYLLLALLGSLFYLLGVALVYGQTGVLDMTLVGAALEDDVLARTALALMTVGLLIKAAIFPLHGWLPAAHGNAPGPVSAILSAMVVKVSIYLIWRLWFWMELDWDADLVMRLLGLLGAGAIVYGSLMALVQPRLKMIVAYSTVAQLGYLMLLFPLASTLAFQAVSYHLLSHGLAKAAMFLAAANLLARLGSDRLDQLGGADRHAPVDVFTLALAGVSILGLPPSGGFIAKWMMLDVALDQQGWLWVVVILVGGLLAAGYLFRVLNQACARPVETRLVIPVDATQRMMSGIGLLLALAALAAGFVSAPILELLGQAWLLENAR